MSAEADPNDVILWQGYHKELSCWIRYISAFSRIVLLAFFHALHASTRNDYIISQFAKKSRISRAITTKKMRNFLTVKVLHTGSIENERADILAKVEQ